MDSFCFDGACMCVFGGCVCVGRIKSLHSDDGPGMGQCGHW